jgi:putative ABC transport system ATP-binding protein
MLETRDLVKHYHVGDGDPIRAVDGVSLSIAMGEFVALYGPSGSGKSTLIDLIAGFQPPDSGTVRIDGCDLSGLSEREHAEVLLRLLGIVGGPEDLLAGASAVENAALKLLRADARHATTLVRPLLEELGLRDRMNHPTGKLSMGERQRVLIAQALALDPKLVLADEPTAHLDTLHSREVLELLRALCHRRGAAILLATHDPQAVGFADRAHELRDGRLKDYEPGELFLDPGSALAERVR